VTHPHRVHSSYHMNSFDFPLLRMAQFCWLRALPPSSACGHRGRSVPVRYPAALGLILHRVSSAISVVILRSEYYMRTH
jgi:hypothetical protein